MITVIVIPFGLGRSCMLPYLICPWSIIRQLWCLELHGPPNWFWSSDLFGEASCVIGGLRVLIHDPYVKIAQWFICD